MLDGDLALLYGVSTKRLNEQVKRNRERFPADFMFQIDEEEFAQVVRAFVRLREILATHKDLAKTLEELERKYDAQFKVVFDAIRALMEPPEEPAKPPIGFRRNN